jgi:PAS domain S-box-containing protein
MHGYPLRKDLIGKKISVFHSEDQMNADVFPMIEEAKRRGQLGGPIEHLRNDGTVFPTQTKMILLKDAEDKAVGLIVFVTDITKRIQAEKSLAKRNIELATANDHLEQFTGQVENLTSKLATIEERLQQQASERRQVEEQLQHQVTKLEQDEDSLNEQASELTATNENLQQQVPQRQQEISQCVLDEEKLRSLAELAKRLSN